MSATTDEPASYAEAADAAMDLLSDAKFHDMAGSEPDPEPEPDEEQDTGDEAPSASTQGEPGAEVDTSPDSDSQDRPPENEGEGEVSATSTLDGEIQRLEKEHAEWREKFQRQQQAAPTPQREQEQRPPVEPRGDQLGGQQADVDLDLMTDTERWLYDKQKAIEDRYSSQNRELEQLRQERERYQHTQAMAELTRRVDTAQNNYPDVFGKESGLAALAKEAVDARLRTTDEPEQLIVARVAKMVREAQTTSRTKYLAGKVKNSQNVSGARGGRVTKSGSKKRTPKNFDEARELAWKAIHDADEFF